MRLFALPTINSLTRKAVLMSQNSDSPKSTRKQTTVFLLAFVIATCAMFGPGIIRRGKAENFLHKNGFIEAAAKENSELFRTHLALYLARHPELNEPQKAIILEGMSLATPELIGMRSDNPDWKAKVQEPTKQFESRVRAFFSKDEGARIFATLGNPKAQDDLLQKYSDIAALPMGKRKAAFRKASPQGKSNLWRTHLALYLAKHPDLNEAQKVIILEGMSLVTPGLYEVRSDSPALKAKATEPVKQFENHILGVFSKDEGVKVFSTLGDPEPPTTLSSSGTLILHKDSNQRESSNSVRNVRTLNRFVSKNRDFEEEEGFYCACSTESDWCATDKHCTSASMCTITTSGCGTLWAYWCNGVCRPDYANE